MRLRAATLVVLVSLGLPRAVGAREPPDEAAAEAARELYDRASRHHELREYDQAIEACRAGYKLWPLPGFLFNIAQAYRLKGDCAEALEFYRSYLRADPAARNRAKVEAFMAEMARCRAKVEARRAPPSAPPPTEPPVVREPPPQRVQPPARVPPAQPPLHADGGGSSRRIVMLLAAATAAGALGASLYYGLDARAKSDEVGQLYERGGMWSTHYDALERDGRQAATRAKIFGLAGGAALAAGAILYAVGWADGEAPAPVSAAPLANGALLTWRARF